MYSSPFESTKILVWLPKTTVSAPRTITNVPSSTPPEECPIVHRKFPIPGQEPGWTIMARDPGVGYPATYAIDGDNSTVFISRNRNHPYLEIDLGRTHSVTKVNILGANKIRESPLVNLEIKVGARSVTSPLDDSSPGPGYILFGNKR